MSVFRAGKNSLRPARRSSPARLFLALVTVAMLAGVLVLTRSEAAAQSAETAQKMTSAPAGNAQHGKTVYTAVGCYECHGRDAQSGGRTARNSDPIPYPSPRLSIRSVLRAMRCRPIRPRCYRTRTWPIFTPSYNPCRNHPRWIPFRCCSSFATPRRLPVHRCRRTRECLRRRHDRHTK